MRPMVRVIAYFLLGVLFATMVLAKPAQAQVKEIETKWICGKTDTLKEDLIRNGERFWASGAIQGSGEPQFLMSLWINPNTGNWTIVATLLRNNSLSCVVTFGTNWREQPRNTI